MSSITCPCRYPVIVTHDGITSLGFPLDELAMGIELPNIFKSEDGKWMVVQWRDDAHEGVKEHDIDGHIVKAGCEKDKLECDIKSIYVVMHPIEEWEKYHVIEGVSKK